ncbi:MAG: FtsQ-type POTRA domain-containing protein [Clostridia bacterium]|nr:FtsQ-type POTRA domain-containing protein [Clostridia bacterium]
MRNKKLIIVLIVITSITLLVVLNSVIFSVQNISAYCYNDSDTALDGSVIENSGIKKGGSIFTLNKDKVIESVTNGVHNVKIINIEKKFPNSVSINYVRIYEYLRIKNDDKYYFCSNDGKIMRISENPGLTTESIELRLASKIENTTEGETFASSSSADVQLTSAILSALEQLGYRREAVEMIDFIDISKGQRVFVKMHSGVMYELQGTGNIAAKLRIAQSVYVGATPEQRVSGTIIVPDGDGSSAAWTKEDRYAKNIE